MPTSHPIWLAAYERLLLLLFGLLHPEVSLPPVRVLKQHLGHTYLKAKCPHISTLNSSKLSWPSPSVSSLDMRAATSSRLSFLVSFPRSLLLMYPFLFLSSAEKASSARVIMSVCRNADIISTNKNIFYVSPPHLRDLPIVVFIEALEEEVWALDDLEEVLLGEHPVLAGQLDHAPGLHLCDLDTVGLEHAEVVVQRDAPLPVLVQLKHRDNAMWHNWTLNYLNRYWRHLMRIIHSWKW